MLLTQTKVRQEVMVPLLDELEAELPERGPAPA
jgi:hypothetical protein